MNIEILAAYFPYDLKMRHSDGRIRTLGFVTSSFKKVISIQSCLSKHSDWLPILRQLSELPDDLFKEIGFADEEDFIQCVYSGDIPYKYMVKLLADHYNVFNLPEGEYIRKL